MRIIITIILITILLTPNIVFAKRYINLAGKVLTDIDNIYEVHSVDYPICRKNYNRIECFKEYYIIILMKNYKKDVVKTYIKFKNPYVRDSKYNYIFKQLYNY